jgi:Cu(I)/Ag(I) efflux system membrane protein CusA/SilA
VSSQIEAVLRGLPGTASVYAERQTGARYMDVAVQRRAAARFGLSMREVQEVVATAISGMNITETVEGRERYPINLRYPPDLRDSFARVKQLPMVTASGAQVALGEIAEVRVADGPDMIRSENARLSGWISVDISGRDLGSYVLDAQRAVAANVKPPPGYSIGWSGQYEYMERAGARLTLLIPLTLAIVVLLLALHLRNAAEVGIILATLPLALVGGFWLLYLLGYNLSVAVGVGFIALGGVAIEIGVVMLAYLDQALARRAARGRVTEADLHAAIVEGALLRIRPVTMTKVAILAALLPILWNSGTGSEPMSRIAAPIVGGMLSVAVLTLVVIPAAYLLWRQRGLSGPGGKP